VPSDIYLDSLKIKKLAKSCFDINNVAALQAIVGSNWPFLAQDGQDLVDKIEATAKAVKERWNQVTKERNERKKQMHLQRASQTPFEELNSQQRQLHTTHEERVSRLNNLISQAHGIQASIIRPSVTDETQSPEVLVQTLSSDFAISIGCDIEKLSQGTPAVALSDVQLCEISVDSQPAETLFSGQLHRAASLAPSVATSRPDPQIISTSPVGKQRPNQTVLRKRLRSTTNALEIVPRPAKSLRKASLKKGTSGACSPLGVLDVNIVAKPI
jgi:hypothetical protein